MLNVCDTWNYFYCFLAGSAGFLRENCPAGAGIGHRASRGVPGFLGNRPASQISGYRSSGKADRLKRAGSGFRTPGGYHERQCYHADRHGCLLSGHRPEAVLLRRGKPAHGD